MQSIVPAFKRKMLQNKRKFITFLTKLEKFKIPEIESIRKKADAQAWQETDCLSCGNCCRSMTPTFTENDLLRIAPHFNMTVDAFKDKWLYFEKTDKDWVNKKQPCQFLNLTDNKCSIYEIRPDDCAQFPHHLKKGMDDYIHVYKQNLTYCPATYRWVELMKEEVEKKYSLYS
jgi:uncharacterized protein